MSKTYREQFDEALACETKEAADLWLRKEIQRYFDEFSIGPEEARATVLANIGYMAGYYSHDVTERIRTLFGAGHPIFGTDYFAAAGR